MAGNDFVMVQISAAGIAFAGGHPIGTSNGRRNFTFAAGVPQRVEKSYEWNAFLSKMVDRDGNSLFEIAPAAPATAATGDAKPAAKAAASAAPADPAAPASK